MKKIIALTLGLGGLLAAPCMAASHNIVNIANETGLAYNNSYTLNASTFPNAGGTSRVSVQVVYSSMSPNAANFTGGSLSTATISVTNNALLSANNATDQITVPATSLILPAPATAQITIVSTAGISGACITVDGGINQASFCNGIDWTSVSTASGTASALATRMHSVPWLDANWPGGTSAVVFASITVLGQTGAFGNSYTLASSSPVAISTSAAVFSGGRDDVLLNSVITFNGVAYKNGYQWSDASQTSNGTALSIMNLMNNFGVVKSTVVGGQSVVYSTATSAGTAGNAFTLSATAGGLSVSGANYSNGRDTATITINGITLAGTGQGSGSFAIGATAAATAINISSAIVNTASMAAIIKSTTTGGQTVVYSTSTTSGTSANYSITFVGQGLSTNNSGFFGGTNSAWAINTPTITVPSHGFTTALPVRITTGSAVSLLPIAFNTNYYPIIIDANNFKLATSQANALAGTAVTLTSSSTLASAPTFTLTPQTIAGGSSYKWQVSNDGNNWTDLTTPSSYTIGTNFVYPSTSTVYDFGDLDYKYLRANVVAPTAGGLGLEISVDARQ